MKFKLWGTYVSRNLATCLNRSEHCLKTHLYALQFIDDDTPAPETSIPVPVISYKPNNYIYQGIYVVYIISFLAYVYVRIQFTLDAPGLNRIYCIVVAILEIITAPSLILQVEEWMKFIKIFTLLLIRKYPRELNLLSNKTTKPKTWGCELFCELIARTVSLVPCFPKFFCVEQF